VTHALDHVGQLPVLASAGAAFVEGTAAVVVNAAAAPLRHEQGATSGRFRDRDGLCTAEPCQSWVINIKRQEKQQQA